MDKRTRKHAEILVDYCTDVSSGDNVLIKSPAHADDLIVAIYEQVGKRGGIPLVIWDHPEARATYLREMGAGDFESPNHHQAAMEAADVVILIESNANLSENSDVSTEKQAAEGRAKQPILEERLNKRWVITQHPAAGDAQNAGMSTHGWTNFVYDAINIDWEAQRAFQNQLVEILDPASEVRVVSGRTDLRFSIEGMNVCNDAGRMNMPGGEVFTAPVIDSVEGTFYVDVPFYEEGHEIRGAELEFRNGGVVAASAAVNEKKLRDLVQSDEGTRHVGEFGVGMNRNLDRFVHNILFDEKMGDTVHIALGRAIDACVPDGRERNESRRHIDLITETAEGSRIEVDGEIVQRDGVYVFEDEFDP